MEPTKEEKTLCRGKPYGVIYQPGASGIETHIEYWGLRTYKGYFMHPPEMSMQQALVKFLGQFWLWINIPDTWQIQSY